MASQKAEKIKLPDIPPKVYADEIPTTKEPSLQEKALQIAQDYGVSTTTLFSLIENESHWKVDAYNEETKDRGIAQISAIWHREVTDEQAYNPDFAIRWAAEQLKKNGGAEYVVCNCYLYVKVLKKNLPKMKDILPNSPPKVGAVAIFDYHGVKHVAYISSLDESGFTVKEANFDACSLGKRHIDWTDPYLVGFFDG